MPPTVLISYSARSAEDTVWKDRLLPQLRVLENAGIPLEVWDEARVDGSAEWFENWRRAVAEAVVVICLISPDYLGSEMVVREEIPFLLETRQKQGMTLIPVLLRPCLWKLHAWLPPIQRLPPDDRWVATDYRDNYDVPFLQVAERVAEVVEQARTRDSSGPSLPIVHFGIATTQVAVDQDLDFLKALKRPFPEWVDITRLPQTGAELFGRSKELALLDAAWDEGRTNLLAFVAWGGVGKSTLVNKWLERMAADGYRGAERIFGWTFYSQGAGERVASADQFIAEALACFGDDDPTAGSPWDKGERLAALSREKRTLLILDGIEPLQSAAGFDRGRVTDPALATLLEELARDNPGLCVVTTRQRIALPDDVPETFGQHDLELLSPEAGRALLRVAGVQGTDAELEAASAAFSNHALAVSLLAAYLRDVPGHPASVANDIPDLPEVSEAEGKHPRRMMAAFAARYGDGPEVELLRMLGLFDRPAPGGALAAVRAAPPMPGLTDHLSTLDEAGWLRLLERLRDDRLIAKADRHAPDEVGAHPLLREHFGALLQAKNPVAYRAGHSRLFDHYRAQAPEFPDTLAEMRPLYLAVGHGCKADRRLEAYDEVYWRRILRKNKAYSLRRLGAFSSDLEALAGFFERLWDLPALELREKSRAFLLASAGFDLRALGRVAEAEGPLRAGLEMRVAQENWKNAARATNNLSELALVRGDMAGAVAYGKQAVAYADRSGDAFSRMVARTTLADVRMQSGDATEAWTLFAEAERMQVEWQPWYLTPLQGYQYCDLLLGRGAWRDVLRRAAQTLEWHQETWGSLLDTALDHLSQGRAHAGLGDFTTAHRELDAAVNGLRAAGTQHHLPRGLLARAALRREMRNYEGARRDLDEATRIAVRAGFRLHEADARLEWARLYLAEGDREKSRKALARGKAIVEETGYHRRDGAVSELEHALREP